MELDLGPELTAFRQEMRDWIAENAPAGLADLVDWNTPSIGGSNRDPLFEAMAHPLYQEWDRKLTDAKLTCAHWPENVGGRGWDAVRSAIFNEELHRARLPRNDRGMGEWLVGPSVIAHGSEEQKKKYLPPIISGEHKYCQGFSEPNHGSDLGAVETRGVVDGDEIVITGQKVWTSGAMRANRIFILCRTDTEAPKHRGLSFVLCDFVDNNIEARPLKQMSGAAEFCEDFIDGARAPLDGVIGGLNNGWRVAMTTLGYERGGRASTQYLGYEREFWELVETARKYGKDSDPLVRQKLAWAYSHVQIMRFQGLRVLSQAARGKQPGPEASASKLFWSEYHKRLGELAVAIEGADALVRPDGDGYATSPWQGIFLASRAGTIYSGTSEIQRNIIAERALGLPK
ncbi:MAG: acyl-CoA dehydrogenase [Streptosporangiales bacterium]|nr:acyl-CoA dehydrogenase [Streptosporangiales bacterium]